MKYRRRQGNEAGKTQVVASGTECTGLMPALPQDEAQDEAEAALYGIHSAKEEPKE